jgi:hypothetical protein
MNAQSLCAMLQAETPYQFKCSDAPRGAIRVRTPYAYPDGERIDVYVLERDDAIEITDFGESIGRLRLHMPKGTLSTKQQRFVENIAHTFGAKFIKGQLVLQVRPSDISEGVLNVSKAAVIVSDFLSTFRTPVSSAQPTG